MTLTTLAFIGGIGVPEMVVVGIIAVLLFGKRVPEVARSIGSSFTAFKRGLNEPVEELKGTIADAKEASAEATRTMKQEAREIETELKKG